MTIALTSHPKVKLTVEDFDILAGSGGLAGLERTELLDGDIYLMSPQYRQHSFPKSVFYDAMLDWSRANAPHLRAMMETSVAMPPNDEPIPDVTLTSEPRGSLGIPVESVALLVEIADESRKRDLGYKAALYARNGVPEYWVVDLKKKVTIRHSQPTPEGYLSKDDIRFGHQVSSLTLDALEVDTRELLY